MSEKNTYSIRELEEISGIPAHTIRTWERRYGLLSPLREAGSTRCYTSQVVGYLRHLGVLLKQGHRISALAAKSQEEIDVMVQELHPPNPDELTESLCHGLREYDSGRVERMMDCYFRKEGFDQALSGRFVPFLEQSGFLLLSGVLKPTHIQIYCQILRQKLLSAIESTPGSKHGDIWLLLHGKTDNDTVHRDILHYLLRNAGHQVVRLDVSGISDLPELLETIKPTGCCIVVDGAYRAGELEQLITTTHTAQGNTLVFTPGKTLDFVNNTQIPEITVMRGLKDAFKHL